MNCSTLEVARTQGSSCGLKRSILAVSMQKPLTINTTQNNNANNSAHGASVQMSQPLNNTRITKAKISSTTLDISKNIKNIERAAKITQQSDIICLDVDSTVICEEGIDELAEFCGKGSEVAQITKEAMGGSMTFQEALKIRLNIIKPSQNQIIDFIKKCPSTITSNVKCLIEQMKTKGKDVYLISGGFDCLIEPVAKALGIPLTHIFANKLMFYHNGEYASFDSTQPTSESGGKAKAIAIIKRRHPHAIITMIGDGATDLEAVPPANYFIGFGGNIMRDEVYKKAQYYIMDFGQLM